jgi:beta-lactamase superfamily II metal-dependent hydrolase
MIRTSFLYAIVLLMLVGCASTGHVDPPWSATDAAEVAQLKEAAARLRGTVAPVPFGPAAAAFAAPADAAPTGPLLEIYIFNIGQADSMLVVGPRPQRRTLLVDLGEQVGGRPAHLPRGAAAHVHERIAAITGGTHIDYFLLSHYHGDHASGIVRLLSDLDTPFTVGELIHVGRDNEGFLADEGDRTLFRRVHQSIESWIDAGRLGRSIAPEFGPGQIDLGSGIEVEILAFGGHAPGETQTAFDRAVAVNRDYDRHPANENDLSIALEIRAGEFELFTAGDLSGTDDPVGHPLYVHRRHRGGKTETYTNVEGHMLREWTRTGRESDVEVYRVNHHGSHYSSTQVLLDALDPEVVIYSVGAQHGHPTVDVIERVDTAHQFATTAVALENEAEFDAAGGEVVEEVEILVQRDGLTYTVEGQQLTARAR